MVQLVISLDRNGRLVTAATTGRRHDGFDVIVATARCQLGHRGEPAGVAAGGRDVHDRGRERWNCVTSWSSTASTSSGQQSGAFGSVMSGSGCDLRGPLPLRAAQARRPRLRAQFPSCVRRVRITERRRECGLDRWHLLEFFASTRKSRCRDAFGHADLAS